MIEALFCIVVGVIGLCAGLCTLIGIAFQMFFHIIQPMCEFIFRLFGLI